MWQVVDQDRLGRYRSKPSSVCQDMLPDPYLPAGMVPTLPAAAASEPANAGGGRLGRGAGQDCSEEAADIIGTILRVRSDGFITIKFTGYSQPVVFFPLESSMPPTIPAYNDHVLRTTLGEHGFSRDLCSDNVDTGGFTVPLVAFSHRPFDTRTACLAAIPPTNDVGVDIGHCSRIGVPLVFVGTNAQWDVWYNTQEGPQLWWPKARGSISKFFQEIGQRVTPQAIFRAKTLARVDATEQLEFVDLGAFELVERDAGRHLTKLITSMIRVTSENLGWGEDLPEGKSQWLVRANFWLLAARILHDKNVPSFKRLDLADVEDVFARVRKHYDADFKEQEPTKRIAALAAAVAELKRSPSLSLISTEALADPFENALITKETRRANGTHSTPGWLVEYMLGRLRPWIEELAAQNRAHVFEPACGHAPFLLGALRLLSSLPPCDHLDDVKRHDYLKQRLHGCERDDFAREVARLSLTLADIPNPNGWDFGRDGDHDLFRNNCIERGVKNADIVLCNPPFEADRAVTGGAEELFRIKKAAEILRRTVGAAKAGTVLGFIVPQSMLDSHKLADLRHDLTRDFEWMEICRLPDGVFEKADVETAIILGRRHTTSELKLTIGPTSFRHVLDGDQYRTTFREKYQPTTEQLLPLTRVAPPPSRSLWVPDMLEVWDALSEFPTLGKIASVGQGFIFRSESDPRFPKGETQTVISRTRGYAPGFLSAKHLPNTHQLPSTALVNRNQGAIRRPIAGYQAGAPQVVMNYAPVRRGPWRNQAFIDSEGHPTSSNFLVIRPNQQGIDELFLWAILNSPLCNAFTASNCSKRHIYAKKLEGMRLPNVTPEQVSRVKAAARCYRDAAASWSATRQEVKTTNKRFIRRSKLIEGQMDLTGLNPVEEFRQLEELKYLHWRMDAAVLAIYNLPAKLERQLLDYFTGELRVGVPFEQREYFPSGFEGAERLSDLLAFTVDWPKNARREAKLIKKEYDDDGLPLKELEELERLQRLGALHLRLVSSLNRGELDAEIERLKREGKWTE